MQKKKRLIILIQFLCICPILKLRQHLPKILPVSLFMWDLLMTAVFANVYCQLFLHVSVIYTVILVIWGSHTAMYCGFIYKLPLHFKSYYLLAV